MPALQIELEEVMMLVVSDDALEGAAGGVGVTNTGLTYPCEPGVCGTQKSF